MKLHMSEFFFHLNPKIPLVLATDASLMTSQQFSHKMHDNIEKPNFLFQEH